MNRSLRRRLAKFCRQTYNQVKKLCSSRSKLPSHRRLSPLSKLQFMSFVHNQSSFVGLIDSGSELNLISHSLLPFLNYKRIESPTQQLRGVSADIVPIHQWIEIDVELDTAVTITIPLAVVTNLPCVVLLGLPFLEQVKGCHDVANRLLITPSGPILLSTQVHGHHNNSNNAAIDPELKLDMSNSNLTPEEQQELRMLLLEYDDLWRGGRRGKAVGVEHQIKLMTDRPIVSRPRTTTPEQKQAIQEEVNKMLKDGVIQHSDSPYASEIVLVMKHTGDWRFCLDFRPLNKQTIPDKYPLPRISDLIRSIKNSKYFVALDLKAGYWQIPMAADSIKYTAFRCFLGLFEHLVMPFGLTNAPATFQRLMDFLFGDYRFRGILAYLDDILVHGASFREVMKLLRMVFQRLRVAGLTLNLPKSIFFPLKLKYLGQLIIDGKLIPDPEKVEAIGRITPPTTVQGVKRLLGFLCYYQPFVHRFSEILRPVFDLLPSKSSKKLNAVTEVVWGEAQENAKNEIVHRLQQAVLRIPVDSNEFLLETDASDKAIAAILSVKTESGYQPVEFYSKSLGKTQQRWPVREKEAFAIVSGLTKFDSYLRGRSFDVHTDHESLKWMLDCPKGKIARWASLLAEYDMKVYYCRGEQLLHVDFLTRFLDTEPDPILQPRMTYFTSTQHRLPQLPEILQAQSGQHPVGKGFAQKDGVYYYHGLVWVPPAFRTKVIAACHSTAPLMHPGIKKTSRILLRLFNWPGLYKDVVAYVQSCLYCQRARSGCERLQGHLRTHPIPGPFETVYMDFWQLTYDSNEFVVLTLIDQFSKWPEAVVLPNKTAKTVAVAFLVSWIYRFGVPKLLLCDGDKSFLNEVFDALHARLGTSRITSAPYHPEGNGIIENFHRTLNHYLRFINHSRLPFDECLQMILFAFRSSLHSTTGHSPALLALGTDLRLPADSDWRTEPNPPLRERYKFLQHLRLNVQCQAEQLRMRRNAKTNEGRVDVQFEEGQLVLVRLLPAEATRYKSSSYKVIPQWSLPFRVVRVYPGGKRAIVRSLLNSKTRDVHLQNVRFIGVPLSDSQRDEWKDVVEQDLSMFDPPIRRTMLEEFFDKLDTPQATTSPPIKRPRPTTALEGPVRDP